MLKNFYIIKLYMEYPTDGKFSNMQVADTYSDLLSFKRLNPSFSDIQGGERYLIDNVLIKNEVTGKHDINLKFLPKDFIKMKYNNGTFTIDDVDNTAVTSANYAGLYNGQFHLLVNGVYVFRLVDENDPAAFANYFTSGSLKDHNTSPDGRSEYTVGTIEDPDDGTNVVITIAPRVSESRNDISIKGIVINIHNTIPQGYY